MAEVARGTVVLTADTRRLQRDMNDAEGRVKRMGHAMKVGLAAGATAAVGGLFMLGRELGKTIKAAQEAEQVQKREQAQLKALSISYRKHASEIDRTIARVSRLAAVDDEELHESFTRLVGATKNVDLALKLMGTAADVARGRNISLEAATSLVTKASMGQAGALRRLGIDFKPVTDAQDRLRDSGRKYTDAQMEQAKALDATATKQAAVAALQGKYAGQAEAYGKTSSGAIDRFHIAIENVREAIGSKLLPVFTPLISSFADWASKLAESKGFQEGVQRAAEGIASALKALVAWIVAHKEDFVAVFRFMVERVKVASENIRSIIAAFQYVREKLTAFGVWWRVTWLKFSRDAIEPLTHIPEFMGGELGKARDWAQQRKREINAELDKINADKARKRVERLAAALEDLPPSVRTIVTAVVRIGAQVGSAVRPPMQTGGGNFPNEGDGLVSAINWAAQEYANQNPAAFAPIAPATGSAAGLVPGILDELGLARRYGLGLTSGRRAPAKTASGGWSLHGSGRAIDVAGAPTSMAMYAQAVAGRPGVQEVLYTPVGGWYPGAGWVGLSGKLAQQHYSHVHVGVTGDGIVGTASRTGDGPGDVVSRQVAHKGQRARVVQQIRDNAERAETAADRRITVIDRESSLLVRRLERTDPVAANRERARASREIAGIHLRVARQLWGFSNQARALKERALMNELRQKAFDREYEARVREADAADADAAVAEAGGTPDAPGAEPGAAPGDAGAGGGGGGAAEGWDIPMEQLIQEEATRMVTAHRESLMRIRHGFLSEFGPNIFSQGEGGLTLGSGALGSVRPPVTIVQNITKVDPDPFELSKSAKFVAETVM
jgi:hypothetical protein